MQYTGKQARSTHRDSHPERQQQGRGDHWGENSTTSSEIDAFQTSISKRTAFSTLLRLLFFVVAAAALAAAAAFRFFKPLLRRELDACRFPTLRSNAWGLFAALYNTRKDMHITTTIHNCANTAGLESFLLC